MHIVKIRLLIEWRIFGFWKLSLIMPTPAATMTVKRGLTRRNTSGKIDFNRAVRRRPPSTPPGPQKGEVFVSRSARTQQKIHVLLPGIR